MGCATESANDGVCESRKKWHRYLHSDDLYPSAAPLSPAACGLRRRSLIAVLSLAVWLLATPSAATVVLKDSIGCTPGACWNEHGFGTDVNGNFATVPLVGELNCSSTVGLLTSVNSTSGATLYNQYLVGSSTRFAVTTVDPVAQTVTVSWTAT